MEQVAAEFVRMTTRQDSTDEKEDAHADRSDSDELIYTGSAKHGGAETTDAYLQTVVELKVASNEQNTTYDGKISEAGTGKTSTISRIDTNMELGVPVDKESASVYRRIVLEKDIFTVYSVLKAYGIWNNMQKCDQRQLIAAMCFCAITQILVLALLSSELEIDTNNSSANFTNYTNGNESWYLYSNSTRNFTTTTATTEENTVSQIDARLIIIQYLILMFAIVFITIQYVKSFSLISAVNKIKHFRNEFGYWKCGDGFFGYYGIFVLLYFVYNTALMLFGLILSVAMITTAESGFDAVLNAVSILFILDLDNWFFQLVENHWQIKAEMLDLEYKMSGEKDFNIAWKSAHACCLSFARLHCCYPSPLRQRRLDDELEEREKLGLYTNKEAPKCSGEWCRKFFDNHWCNSEFTNDDGDKGCINWCVKRELSMPYITDSFKYLVITLYIGIFVAMFFTGKRYNDTSDGDTLSGIALLALTLGTPFLAYTVLSQVYFLGRKTGRIKKRFISIYSLNIRQFMSKNEEKFTCEQFTYANDLAFDEDFDNHKYDVCDKNNTIQRKEQANRKEIEERKHEETEADKIKARVLKDIYNIMYERSGFALNLEVPVKDEFSKYFHRSLFEKQICVVFDKHLREESLNETGLEKCLQISQNLRPFSDKKIGKEKNEINHDDEIMKQHFHQLFKFYKSLMFWRKIVTVSVFDKYYKSVEHKEDEEESKDEAPVISINNNKINENIIQDCKKLAAEYNVELKEDNSDRIIEKVHEGYCRMKFISNYVPKLICEKVIKNDKANYTNLDIDKYNENIISMVADIFKKYKLVAIESGLREFITYRNFNIKNGVIIPYIEKNDIWRNQDLRSVKGQRYIKKQILSELDKYRFLFRNKNDALGVIDDCLFEINYHSDSVTIPSSKFYFLLYSKTIPMRIKRNSFCCWWCKFKYSRNYDCTKIVEEEYPKCWCCEKEIFKNGWHDKVQDDYLCNKCAKIISRNGNNFRTSSNDFIEITSKWIDEYKQRDEYRVLVDERMENDRKEGKHHDSIRCDDVRRVACMKSALFWLIWIFVIFYIRILIVVFEE